MTKINQRFKSIIIILLAVLLFISSLVTLLPMSAVKAEASKYTTVVEDFSKDSDNSITDVDFGYLSDPNVIIVDKVLQIGEGEDGELFIYTGQKHYGNPESDSFLSVNISIAINENAKWVSYDLEYIDSYYNIYKYLVKDFTVKSEELRYYDISSVFRPFNPQWGDTSSSGNVVDGVAIAVGQLWTVCTVENNIHYSMDYTDIVEIKNPYVGTLRFHSHSINPWEDSCDSHFIAFSTDWQIDDLLEADVSFYKQTRHRNSAFTGMGYELSDPVKTELTLTYDQSVKYETGVFIKDRYEWKRIESRRDFVKNNEMLTDEQKAKVSDCTWVLRFYETYFVEGTSFWDLVVGEDVGTEISSVSILRLKFLLHGETYNLGAVCNKQTGTEIWNGNKEEFSFGEWWQSVKDWFSKYWYWFVIGGIALFALIVLSPFLPMILSGIVNLLILLFKGLWWLISAPVRLIVALVKKDE